MDILLLKTKFVAPEPLNDYLSIAAFGKLILLGLKKKLTYISSPPGFGKTSSLTDFLSKETVTFSYLSLESNDNEFNRFWLYFIRAMQKADPELGEEIINLFQINEKINSTYLLSLLINEISQKNFNYILILDDYHLINNPQIHQSLSYFIEKVSANFHLFINSRISSHGLNNINLLKAKNQMIEIHSEIFRIKEDDIISFLERNGYTVEQQIVKEINQSIDGWILGLRFLLLTIQENGLIYLLDNLKTNRYINDFLSEEIWDKQTPEIKDFILKTSVVKQFNPELAVILSGNKESKAVIEHLKKNNLFLQSLAENWYRFQSPLLQVIKDQISTEQQKSFKRLHYKAAKWFEKNNNFYEAIDHGFAAEDYDLIVELMCKIVVGMDARGEIYSLSDWFSRLPDEYILKSKLLFYFKCAILIQNNAYDSALSLAEKMKEKMAEFDMQTQNFIKAQLLNLQTLSSFYKNDFQEIKQLTGSAVTLAEGDTCLTGITYYNHAFSLFKLGELSESIKAFGKSAEFSIIANNYLNILKAMASQARVMYLGGDLINAGYLLNDLIKKAGLYGLSKHPIVLNSYGELALISYYNGNINSLYSYTEVYDHQNLESAEALLVRFWLSLIFFRLNVPDKAFGYLELPVKNNQQTTELKRGMLLILSSAIKLKKVLLKDYFPNKVDSADINIILSIIDNFNPGFTPILLTLLEYYLKVNQLSRAEFILEKITSKMEKAKLLLPLINFQLLQAETMYLQGKYDQVKVYLEKALNHPNPENFNSIFIDLPAELLKILIILLEDKAKKDKSYTAILEKIKYSSSLNIFEPTGLSERELEIVRLLCQDLSNQEISDTLTVSLNTIKTHLKNIYRKLNVQNRTEAILIAKRKGLY